MRFQLLNMVKQPIQKFAGSLLFNHSGFIASACKLFNRFVNPGFSDTTRPITTYRSSGTLQRPDPLHHSVAYTTNNAPELLEGEVLNRYAIKIDAEDGECLQPESRINFSKIYTIEHNVKVKKIGKVAKEYLVWVLHYCKESTGIVLKD